MPIEVPAVETEVFVTALRSLNQAAIPFVVAGAFCTHYYTGSWRYTKDMDLFARPAIVPRALEILQANGYKTWIEAGHWLGKATKEECIVDIIFGSGNWLSPIDEKWLERSEAATLFGEPVRMAPIEEMIWAKAYIAGRERYDGADVCHLIAARQGCFDWPHLLGRFADHWLLLLSYLTLFSFIYPSNQQYVPEWVINELTGRLTKERRRRSANGKICRGTLLDRFSYNYDVERLGYVDAREHFALASGASTQDVVGERAWAGDRLARGEVYRRE